MNQYIFLFVFVLILLFDNFKYTHCSQTYTEKEKNALVKFKELVADALYKDYMKSDPYLIRWIRARDFDLNEATTMLRATLKWRQENKIDGIMSENIYEFKNPPFYFSGYDNEGSVVAVLIPNRVDLRAHLINGRRPLIIRCFDQLLEIAESQTLELSGIHPYGYTLSILSPTLKFIGNETFREGVKSEKAVVIMDMHGYSLRQHACFACFGVYIEWFQHMENYYPGYAKRFIIVNAPRIAKPIFDLINPILSPTTRDIFEIYGTNKNEWLPALLKSISPNELTQRLGGTKIE